MGKREGTSDRFILMLLVVQLTVVMFMIVVVMQQYDKIAERRGIPIISEVVKEEYEKEVAERYLDEQSKDGGKKYIEVSSEFGKGVEGYVESEVRTKFGEGILEQGIVHYKETGNEALVYYEVIMSTEGEDPDEIEYIKAAKESGNKYYGEMYTRYKEGREVSIGMKVIEVREGEYKIYTPKKGVNRVEWEEGINY